MKAIKRHKGPRYRGRGEGGKIQGRVFLNCFSLEGVINARPNTKVVAFRSTFQRDIDFLEFFFFFFNLY